MPANHAPPPDEAAVTTVKLSVEEEAFRLLVSDASDRGGLSGEPEVRRITASGQPHVYRKLAQLLAELELAPPGAASHSAPQSAEAPPCDDPAIAAALAAMHRAPGQPWTLASLASEVGLSRSSFTSRFRKAVGEPPLAHLTERRMLKAKELLVNHRLGLKQIATEVGYESASAFSAAFKRRFGAPPSRYRRVPSRRAE